MRGGKAARRTAVSWSGGPGISGGIYLPDRKSTGSWPVHQFFGDVAGIPAPVDKWPPPVTTVSLETAVFPPTPPGPLPAGSLPVGIPCRPARRKHSWCSADDIRYAQQLGGCLIRVPDREQVDGCRWRRSTLDVPGNRFRSLEAYRACLRAEVNRFLAHEDEG